MQKPPMEWQSQDYRSRDNFFFMVSASLYSYLITYNSLEGGSPCKACLYMNSISCLRSSHREYRSRVQHDGLGLSALPTAPEEDNPDPKARK